MTLTAASSDESIATVTVNGTDIVVTPVAEGTATITVTADDGNGGKVNTTFGIVVSNAPTTGDGTGEDGTTGDDTAGDDTTGDDTAGDGTTGDDTAGDGTTGDDTAG
ncbi:MAG: Ig-like domain-containing protein, partial [Bacillota bacterium]